jgi:D-alanine-D-alanine ligase-like ATP-grasp enzyme
MERVMRRLDRLVDLLYVFEGQVSRLAPMRVLKTVCINSLFHFFLWCRVFRETTVSDGDPRFFHRTTCVVYEARRRGIEMKALLLFGRPKNFFVWSRGGRKCFFECLPCYDVSDSLKVDVDDKACLRRLLTRIGVPMPLGRVFRDPREATRYAQAVGFPLVVKPHAGSLSQHVTCDIRDAVAFQDAVRIARLVGTAFVVERHVPGSVYRVTLVGGVFVAACQREPPNVVGDGVATIRELVMRKNEDPRRGHAREKHTTLHKILLTEDSEHLLKEQGMGWKDILACGRKVFLHTKVILACGADIHDCTNAVHADTRELLQRAARACQAPVIGFDLICEDIAKPYAAQSFAILEANSLPYIDMHHVPVTGTPRNVAGAIMDLVLKPF